MFEKMKEWMTPERAAAFQGLGIGLSQLGAGQPVNLSPAYEALAARKQSEAMRKAMEIPGIMDRFTPQQQAVLATMPAELATKIIMEQAFAPAPEPVKGISVGGNIVNPVTGEVIYSSPGDQAAGTEYGLVPQYGVDADGNPVMIQIGKDGTAVQTKLPDGVTFQKGMEKVDAGTEWVLIDPITRQPVGRIPKELYAAEQEKAAGKAAGEDTATLESMSSKMDGLDAVVERLGQLADKATYTYAGQARDEVMKQLGMEPTEAAVARAEYTAMVDNQVLPLLRDTFGAQFTEREGQALRATLGDPNKSPAEKKAVLKAFIEQKRRDVAGLKERTGAVDAPSGAVVIDGFTIEEVQ